MDSMLILVGRGLTTAQFEYDDVETTHRPDVVPAARPATGVRRTRIQLAHALHRAADRVAPAL